MTTYEILSLGLELTVVFILIAEFIYDAWWNGQEQRKKRKVSKPRIVYEKDMD